MSGTFFGDRWKLKHNGDILSEACYHCDKKSIKFIQN